MIPMTQVAMITGRQNVVSSARIMNRGPSAMPAADIRWRTGPTSRLAKNAITATTPTNSAARQPTRSRFFPMIAPRQMPQEFYDWNRRHRAPFGRRNRLSGLLGIRYRGPFAFQANNSTRVYEYPWAYSAINAHRAARGGRFLDIVELGG